ncbi:MAG: YegS/Rv2252/BmrU family lipid kinase [Cyanobacteriota bacterium]
MNRSACLIYNPVAGQGDSETDLQRIRELLEPEIDLDIRLTTKEVDADQLARTVVKEGASTLIVSGGDGTLSAAASALVRTCIPLGVIPRGTANAFARALGIPVTLEAACQTILNGCTRVVDAARCNGKPMMLLAGMGLGAKMVEDAERSAKNRFGTLAYILGGVKQLWQMEFFEVRIETEDKVVTVKAAAVTVANAAPPTSILAQGPAGVIVDDGMLDITIVAPANAVAAIRAGFHLLKTARRGIAVERSDIGYLRSRFVKVTTEPPQKVALDGELIGTTPVEIECIPESLTILVPKLS